MRRSAQPDRRHLAANLVARHDVSSGARCAAEPAAGRQRFHAGIAANACSVRNTSRSRRRQRIGRPGRRWCARPETGATDAPGTGTCSLQRKRSARWPAMVARSFAGRSSRPACRAARRDSGWLESRTTSCWRIEDTDGVVPDLLQNDALPGSVASRPSSSARLVARDQY